MKTMMLFTLGMIGLIILSGCTLVGGAFDPDEQVRAFTPQAMNADGSIDASGAIADASGYARDRVTCIDVANAHAHNFSAAAIAAKAGEGASANAGQTAVAGNPLVLVAGAAGGASGELLADVGLDAGERKFKLARCMDLLGARRGTYRIVDPVLKGQ